MLQKHPNTSACLLWTREEIEQLRNCMQTTDIAPIDSLMFGKRFSEIILRTRNSKKDSLGKTEEQHASLTTHLLRCED
jgi:hypothetical protein